MSGENQHLPPTSYLIPNINRRDILNKMLLPIRPRPPQEPRDNIRLDRVSNPAGVGDRADHVLGLLEGVFDALAAEGLVGVEGFFHGVRPALFDPPRQAAGEEHGVLEDDARGFALGGHGVLGGGLVGGGQGV